MGALDGILVLDFGQYIAGPMAAMLLGDQGADVVRVEPPGGPRWQTPANGTWNRGKRSIVLDLKAAGDLEIARQLVASADVLIENFRPGVMDRLGLGARETCAANPRLVYCSMPGFAADDPRAGVAAWEGVVGAATATYTRAIETPDARPIYTAVPISSSYAAMVGVTAIAIALAARERDGLGERIEVPLFDATFQAIGVRGFRVHNPDVNAPGIRGATPWVRQYECADGRWVQFHAANSRFIRQFVEAAGVTQWKEEGLTDRARALADPALQGELLRQMIALFKTRTAQEWEDTVSAAGTPTAVCRSSAEWLGHPHALDSEMVVDIDDPGYGRMRQVGIPVRMSSTPGAIRGPAPPPDQDRAAILASLPAAPALVPAISSEPLRAALEGVRVLDLCIILAGPTCGRTLAEFGADVIKIDYPGREGGVAFHHDINRAKRSILLDLGKPDGLDVFWRLVGTADVVVQNYRQGAVERLGIDYESVRKRRPDIVYASLNAYGDTGPWADRPGWEQLAQAATGMQARYGGDGPPVLQPFPVNDYGTGFMGAFAVGLALRHRRRTGEGQHVQTALARTACLLQSAFMHDFEGKTWDEPRGQDALGSGPLHRLYAASDGWFFLGAREDDGSGLDRVEGLSGARGLKDRTLEAFLEERFATRPAGDWVRRLVAAGFGAHSVVTVGALMEDPWVRAHGLSVTREHDGMGLVTTNGPSPRLSRTPVVAGRPAPFPGADAADILRDIGRDKDLARLVETGAIVLPSATTGAR